MENDSSDGGIINNGGLIRLTVAGNLVTTGQPRGGAFLPDGTSLLADANFRIILARTPVSISPTGGAPVGPAIIVRQTA
jgi:hypothetical protein